MKAALIVLLVLLAACGKKENVSTSYLKDNSDPPGGSSGLVIYTDNLTGCQYLGIGISAVTPRLDAQGRPICRGTP